MKKTPDTEIRVPIGTVTSKGITYRLVLPLVKMARYRPVMGRQAK